MNTTTFFRQSRGIASGAMLGAGLLGLAACALPEVQPDLTRFFVLTATATTSAAPGATAAQTDARGDAAATAVRVVVRPVGVPEFLRGRIMGVRLAQNEVRFIDQARWAEPLESGLTRVIRENIAQAPAVRVVDRDGDPHDFEVLVQLRRCEGVLPAGVARLAARIEIYAADVDPKLVAQEDFSTDIAGWDGKDYGALTGKLSEAAGALSARIVALVPTAKP